MIMKKTYLFLAFFAFLAVSLSAQVPQKLSWQGIVRDAAGTPLTAPVELRFSILQNAAAVFTEQITRTPNAFGLVVWNIGEVEAAAFTAIDWAGGAKTLQVEMRTTVGSGNFTVVGTEELKSVPYALVAGKALSDSDNQTISLSGNTLSIAGGNTVTLPADGDGSSTNEIQTIALSGQTLTLSNGGGSVTLPTDGDGSATNEIQAISLNGQTLSLSNGGGSVNLPTDGDGSATNEIQTITLSGQTLSLSNGGGSVNLPAGTAYTAGNGIGIDGNVISNTGDADNNPTNEIQALSLTGQTITLSNGGGSVTLPPDADTQTLSVTGQDLTITGGNTVTLPADGDGSATNELQTLTLAGQTLSLSNGGGSVDLPTGATYTAGNGIEISGGVITNTGDADNDVSNEIQHLTLSNDSLQLSQGGGLVLLNDTSSTNELQALTLAGATLTLSKGGGSVTVHQAGPGINISGNNTISAIDPSPVNELQTLSLSGNQLTLSPSGGTVSLPSGSSFWAGSSGNIYNTNGGNVGIGTSFPSSKLDVAGSLNVGASGPAVTVNNTEAIWYNGYYSWGYGGFNNYFNSVVSVEVNVCCWALEVGGDVAKPGGGSWSALSDRRYKQNVQPFTDGLESLLKINPVRYHYNPSSGYDTNQEYVGVIAQELQPIAPYMVKEMPAGRLNGTENPLTASTAKTPGDAGQAAATTDTYLSVDNSAMTYMLINAIKEQQAQIKQLEARVEHLEKITPRSGRQ